VALHTGIRLRTVAIKPIDQLGEMELQRNVEDAIEYYDGRTNETMGSFGDIHTARKQREFVADAVMNLNGLGGELYRNRERLPPYDFALEDWINCYVIGVNGGRAFCSDMARQRFVGRLSWKFNEILGSGQLRRVDRHWARRWYRNVWLPFFAGPRLSAENRVCLSYMPFADGEVSASALAATPFIGSHGEFEAEMIRRLESSVASLPSSYGHGFARSPLKRRAFDLGVSMVPLRARLLRHCAQFKWSHRPKVANERWKASFASALSYLKEFVPAVNIDILMQEEMSRNRILYIAEFMYRHRDNIDASEWNAVV
jgi:hypothetical protein